MAQFVVFVQMNKKCSVRRQFKCSEKEVNVFEVYQNIL